MSDDKLNEPAAIYSGHKARGEFARLADEIFRGKVLRARAESPEEKLLAGQRLFDYACRITLAGIRHQNPTFNDDDCQNELRARLAMRKRRERPA